MWCLFEIVWWLFVFSCWRLEENVAGINEGVEFIEQEDQDQDYFVEQQGKLPSILHMLLISKQVLHTKVWKN